MPHRTDREFSGCADQGNGADCHQSGSHRIGEPQVKIPERALDAGRCSPAQSGAGQERAGDVLKSKLLLLNAALLVAIGVGVWRLREAWAAARVREEAVLHRRVTPKSIGSA